LVRRNINGQLTDYLEAAGIPWTRESVPDGRQLYRIEGVLLTTGEACDKYLPGGFKGNFGKVIR
jgi:hypothetical protein